jgi:hypothetical protein
VKFARGDAFEANELGFKDAADSVLGVERVGVKKLVSIRRFKERHHLDSPEVKCWIIVFIGASV